MTFTIDDLIKLILVFALCFAIIGISWQLIRILGEFITTIKETNFILKSVRELTEKFVEDYDYLIEQVKFIIDSISMLSKAVVVPISKVFGFLRNIEDLPFLKKKQPQEKEQKKEKG